jgi:flagellar hook-associated protein 2
MIDNNIVKSLGAGSGVDSANIIKQLKEIEKAGPQARIDAKKLKAETQISDFGLISSSLTALKTAATALTDKEGFFSKSATYTPSEAFAPVKLDTKVASGTYAFDIAQIAKAQSLSSGKFNSLTDPVGTGTLTFELGSWTDSGSTNFELDGTKTGASVTIDSSNNTLQGLRDAINKASFGVQASVIKDGTGYRLALTAASGQNNQLRITASEDGGAPSNDDNTGLSRFIFNQTTKQLGEDQKGQDAKFTVNGLNLSRDKNKIDDVVEGFTFQLTKGDPGKVVSVTISDDKAFAEEKVRAFVDAYNTFLSATKPAFAYDEEKQKYGSLAGDSLGKSVLTSVKSIIAAGIPGLEGANTTALTNVGIRTSITDGTLQINETDFRKAFDTNFEGLQRLFSPDTRSTNGAISVNSFGKQTVPGSYDVVVTTPPKQGFNTGAVLAGSFPLDSTGKIYQFKLKANGVDSDLITLPADKVYASTDELISQLQTSINSDPKLLAAGITLTAGMSGGALQLTSTRYGSNSSVEFTDVHADAQAELGLSIGIGTKGIDVAGTVNGKAAFGFANVLRPDLGEKAEGLNLLVTENATTAKVTYSKGFGGELNSLIDKFLLTKGLLDNRKTELNDQLGTFKDDQKNLDRRVAAFEVRMSRQFRAMESILNGMSGSGKYLDNLFKSLPFTASNS